MGKTRDFADIFGFYKVLHSPTCKGSGARGEGMALVNVLRRWDFTYHCFMDGDNVSMGLLFIVWMSHHPCGSLHALSIGLVFLLTAFLGHRHLAAVAIAAGSLYVAHAF